MLCQQGDVLIKKVSKIKGKKVHHLVLAEGELTGHKHQIVKGDACLYDDNGVLYLRIESEIAYVRHPEHDWKKKLRLAGSLLGLTPKDIWYLREVVKVDLSQSFEKIIEQTPSETLVPQGDYVIEKVREYDHFAEEAKNVQD